jgi:hypothetical protein
VRANVTRPRRDSGGWTLDAEGGRNGRGRERIDVIAGAAKDPVNVARIDSTSQCETAEISIMSRR